MEVIPVIDIRGGQVVRAAATLAREDYPPLLSPLCPDASPVTLVDTLARSPGTRCIYVADLDALSGRGTQSQMVRSLALRFPRIEFWLDAGFRSARELATSPALHNVVPVIGSETWEEDVAEGLTSTGSILSLDFRAAGAVGIGRLALPGKPVPGLRVIVMSLDRMGQPQGPDFARLTHLRRQSPDSRWMLAGGIRDLGDVQTAAALGASGVLVSTALHNGRIPLA